MPTPDQGVENKMLENAQPSVRHLYPTSCHQGSGIPVEDGAGRLWEPEVVDDHGEAVCSHPEGQLHVWTHASYDW